MMRVFVDYSGRAIRLTGERWRHILARHPEMASIENLIGEALFAPEVEMSGTSPESWVYARFFEETPLGNKWVIVVARIDEDDAFVLSAWTQNRL